MNQDSDYLQSMSDLFLCLARAFLAPTDKDFVAAFRSDLVDDLNDIAAELSFACNEPAELLRDSLTDVGDDLLLQTYSALFLQPPIRVFLNASVHLDGSLMGPSAKAIDDVFRSHGLQPAEKMRDLPDHLSRLLEFTGLRYAHAAESEARGHSAQACKAFEEARKFAADFLQPWLPGFAVEIRTACEEMGLPTPYQHLAELAAIAAWEGDAWREIEKDSKRDRPEREPRQTACSQCGKAFAEDAALVAVQRIMEKRGLDISHLDRCPHCRGLTDNGKIEALDMAELGVANRQ
ncbi:MAG: molecular chaperone TorD family protein [Rhodocyclaceae bacterium]|nr:molecular chaperone TorD family protein [Rhodocyclaceae bacterium]MDZ4215143.1 molecular chaperone TorD family protein [Rhodocyclaceae bacterium]